jgi:filamentous hemagglutinin
MEPADHKRTASYQRGKEQDEYRARQRELIQQGRFREAVQMDVDDIRSKFGSKYDAGIDQMLRYVHQITDKGPPINRGNTRGH